MHACLWVVWCQYDTCSTYMAALWGILWTLSAIQEWLFGLVGLIEWFYWAVYHVVLFVAIVQRQTQSVIAALLLMPCCIPSQSAGPSSLGAVWELWLFDRGKARLALRVPTLQVTIDWVITGSNSELVLWENPSWYHFYWAIWMNYVDWSPICPLDWIGFYDNLENNLFQNWSSKYSRMHMDHSVAFVANIFFLHFPHVNFQEFVYECFAIVQWDEGVYVWKMYAWVKLFVLAAQRCLCLSWRSAKWTFSLVCLFQLARNAPPGQKLFWDCKNTSHCKSRPCNCVCPLWVLVFQRVCGRCVLHWGPI